VTIARVAAFAVAALLGSASPSFGSSYSTALQNAATQLDHAANAGAHVPDVHVPPAPLGGPPRYSPSVDDWLQATLNAARREHSAKSRATSLRSIAAALRYLSDPSALQSPIAQPPRDVAATAATILAQPAYREAPTKAAPPPKETIWEKMWRWIFDKIGQAFEGISRATQRVPFLGDIFAVVLIGVAVLGLAYVGYRIADGFLVRRRPPVSDDGELLPVGASAEQLHQAALEAARAGSYARAVALLFHASLIVLDRTDRVAYDPSRTAGEYRRLVRRKAQPIAADFDSLARIFTTAAYADEPVDERDWMQASAAFAVVGRPLVAG
jgi:hypothetical protein